jgi:hypothetical protein
MAPRAPAVCPSALQNGECGTPVELGVFSDQRDERGLALGVGTSDGRRKLLRRLRGCHGSTLERPTVADSQQKRGGFGAHTTVLVLVTKKPDYNFYGVGGVLTCKRNKLLGARFRPCWSAPWH